MKVVNFILYAFVTNFKKEKKIRVTSLSWASVPALSPTGEEGGVSFRREPALPSTHLPLSNLHHRASVSLAGSVDTR